VISNGVEHVVVETLGPASSAEDSDSVGTISFDCNRDADPDIFVDFPPTPVPVPIARSEPPPYGRPTPRVPRFECGAAPPVVTPQSAGGRTVKTAELTTDFGHRCRKRFTVISLADKYW
jgi:hypothetical protein